VLDLNQRLAGEQDASSSVDSHICQFGRLAKWRYRFRDSWERLLHFSKTPDLKMYQDAVEVPVGDWTAKRLANMSENYRSRQEVAVVCGSL